MQTIATLIEKQRTNPKLFIKHIVGMDWYWFYEEWFKLFLENKLTLIIASRGLSKSTFFSKLINLWIVFNNEGGVGRGDSIVIGTNHEQASSNILDMKNIIDNNELLQSKKPGHKDDAWSKSEIYYNRNRMQSIGLGGQARGKHLFFMVIDDILADVEKISKEQIKSLVTSNYLPAAMRKLKQGGRVVMVGTRMEEDDIYQTVIDAAKKNPDWKVCTYYLKLDESTKEVFICSSGGAKVKDELLYDYYDLTSLRNADPEKFSREYECQVTSPDATLFPYKDLKDCESEEYFLEKVGDPNGLYVMGVDVARSSRGDYTVMIILKIIKTEDRIVKKIASIKRYKGIDTEQQINDIAEMAKKFNDAYLIVEKNNMGVSFIDLLKNKFFLYMDEYYTDKEKKRDMIDYLQKEIKSEKIIFPTGNDRSVEDLEIVKRELVAFKEVITKTGKKEMKSVGTHDDCVIALALANKAAQKYDTGAPPSRAFTFD